MQYMTTKKIELTITTKNNENKVNDEMRIEKC